LAQDLSILIKATIDPALTKTEIQNKLNGIKDLKVDIGIDVNSISNLTKQIQQLQRSLGNNGKGIKIIDEEQLKDKTYFKTLDDALTKYKHMGEVKITKNFDDATNKVKSFIIELNKADGIIERMKFSSINVAGNGDSINSAFLLDSTKVIDQTQKITEQQLQQRTATNQKIEAINEKEYQNYLKNEEKKTQKAEQEAQKRANAEQRYAEQYEKWWINALDAQEQKQSQSQAKLEALQSKAKLNVQLVQTKFGDKVNANWIDNYISGVNTLTSKTPNLEREFQKLTNTFNTQVASLKNTSNEVYNFGQMLEIAAKKMVVWSAVSTGLFQTWHFITDGIKYVNELNNTLTQISTATNKSQADVLKLGEAYQQLGQQLGATTKEVAAGALEFYRQGLGDVEVIERLKTTTEYAKISGLDFKKSAELLTATTNSMNVSIGKAADVFTYLGDATATGKFVPPMRVIA
jgi:hypothetical protein